MWPRYFSPFPTEAVEKEDTSLEDLPDVSIELSVPRAVDLANVDLLDTADLVDADWHQTGATDVSESR